MTSGQGVIHKSPYTESYAISNAPMIHFMDLWLRSWSFRGRKNVSVLLANRVLWAGKPLRLFFSSRKLSISSIEFSFFSIWTVWPRYARSDNCPISKKKNSISEMKSSLSEKKLRLQVFPSLSNLFPAARNIYSFSNNDFQKWVQTFCNQSLCTNVALDRGIYVPCCWKETAQSWKNSKANFLFREGTFSFPRSTFFFEIGQLSNRA